MLHVAQIAIPTTPVPSPAITHMVHVIREHVSHISGDADTISSPERYAKAAMNQGNFPFIELIVIDGEFTQNVRSSDGYPLLAGSPEGVALRDETGQVVSLSPDPGWEGEVVAAASVTFPSKENLDSAEVDLYCLPGRGDALQPAWEAVQDLCRKRGRTKITVWSDHPIGDDYSSPTSNITLGRCDLATFLTDQGFDLTQTEVCTRLPLPLSEEKLASFEKEAHGKSDGYRTISWVNDTPPQYRQHLVDLMNAFYADMPSAGIVENETVIDVERLVDGEKRSQALGLTSIYTAAEHIESGALVGYTRLDSRADMAGVIQEDTLVLQGHRGHRLGLLIKTANLRYLANVAPSHTFVQTWNAGENDHMRAINDQLGFAPHVVTGQWQITLT